MKSVALMTIALLTLAQSAHAGFNVLECTSKEGQEKVSLTVGKKVEQKSPWGDPEQGPSLVNPVEIKAGANSYYLVGSGEISPLKVDFMLIEGGDMVMGDLKVNDTGPESLGGVLRLSQINGWAPIALSCKYNKEPLAVDGAAN
jgi:hypothetical protein